MKRLFACVSTRTRLATMVIGLSFLCSIIYSMPASAAEFNLSYIGPASSNDRYNLTSHPKHPRVNLRIPVYFKYDPGTTGVTVKDVYRGKDPGNGARFNGYYYMSGDDDGHFDISNFHYDSSTGLWRTDITARLTEKYGQLAEENSGGAIYQFRLELDDHNGIIAYAKGWASQANKGYRVEYNGTWNGGFDEEELRMSLPCDITQDVELGPNQPNQLILFDLDQPRWDHPGTNRGKDIYVTIFDETDGTVAKHYHGPDHDCGEDDYQYHGPECMGENGTLSVRMTMKPGHKYRIKVWPNWVNNLIEYHLPFDNISYATECEPKIDMRAAVDYIDEAGRKRASAQGRYDSQNNSESRSDVFVFDQWGHNARMTWSSKGVSPDPAIIRKEDAKVTPGKFLTWWFRAHNVSGYPHPDKTDFANFRTTFNGSTSGWDEMTVWPPRRATNWFQPSERGGKLDRNHPQVTWGCNEWGANCVDHYDQYNKGVSFGESINYHYRYQVRADDAEKTLCQRVRNSWPVGQDWKERFTPWACAYVPYDYPPNQPPPGGGDKDNSGVVPTARVANGKSTVQAGDDVQFSYSLTNTSGPTVSRQIVYKSYAFILKKEAQLPPNWKQKPYHYAENWGGGNGVGCGGRDINSGTQGWCEQGVGGTSKKIYPGQTWPVPEQPKQPKYNVSGIWLAQPGDRICSYIAIDNNWSVKNDQSANTFRASNIACVVVTKSPNLNLSGSDSYADKGFQGASVSKSDKVPGTDKRGSYSQYGLLTGNRDKVTNFGSAGYTTADSGFSQLACKLSYANTDSAQGNCNDQKNGLKPAYLSKKPLSMPSKPASVKSIPPGDVDFDKLQGSYHKSGNLTIGNNILKSSRHITIFVDGDVTIKGNISIDWSTKYHNLSEIPSFTIKANNIKVEPWVALITGTYVATDHFESCKDANNPADLGMLPPPNSKCQHKLKVNGAIVSEKSPIFRRTFGAGNEPYDNQRDPNNISSTAEWINYTPNLWLTTSNGSSGNQLEGLTTTQVTNLPVRY